MNKRRFGHNGPEVSEVGLGCWQLGSEWGEVTEDEARATLETSLDQGVTFFDTADIYGAGRSETLIGRYLPVRREDLFIASKLGRAAEPGWPDNFGFDAMRRHTEGSLRRLGVEALDLTQLHCLPIEEYRKGEVFENLRRLRQEGKIRRFGASVESMQEALLCLEQEGLSSLQIIFNIFRQKPIETLFDAAKRQGVALIARLPLASGLLAGKFTRDTTFPPDDHRNFNRDGQKFNVGETFAGLPFDKGIEVADRIKSMVPPEMTMAQMALRWILDHDAVTTVIPGARRPAQAVANAEASRRAPLSPELHAWLRDLYQQDVKDHIRGPY